MIACIQRNNFEIFEYLVKETTIDVTVAGYTKSEAGSCLDPLSLAARKGMIQFVKCLIEAREEARSRCDDALYCAATKGQYEVIKYLLDYVEERKESIKKVNGVLYEYGRKTIE